MFRASGAIVLLQVHGVDGVLVGCNVGTVALAFIDPSQSLSSFVLGVSAN